MTNYQKINLINKQNEQTIKGFIPNIKKTSGIYIFYRIDENGIKYAYVGKAEHNILQRLAAHLSGYKSHIDLSIKKYHLYDKDKYPYGYKVAVICYCEPSLCDELERKYIKEYANKGYQMRNTESGGTDGKTLINERKQAKGYREGVRAGRNQLAKELKHIIDLHLQITTKTDKIPDSKALDKFWFLILKELEEEDD